MAGSARNGIKKIGILTFHRSINVGSVAQAVCAVKVIEEEIKGLGSKSPTSEVILIDYRPALRELLTWRPLLMRRWPYVDRAQFRERVALRSWLHSQVTTSAPVYQVRTSSRPAPFARLDLDLICVGSDTVWAPRYGLGYPNPYFLQGLTGCARVALAVSADRPHWGRRDRDAAEAQVRTLAEQFDWISVRDSATAIYLDEIGIERHFDHLPDPTILYDMSRFPTRMPEGFDKLRDAVVGVAISNRRLRAEVISRIRRAGWISLNMLGRDAPDTAGGYVGMPVEEKFGVYRQVLRGLVTDRFHATLFALMLGNYPVAVIGRPAGVAEAVGKAADLLRRIKQEDWLVHENANVSVPAAEAVAILNKDRPKDLSQRLVDYRDAGRRTLSDALRLTLK